MKNFVNLFFELTKKRNFGYEQGTLTLTVNKDWALEFEKWTCQI